MMSSSAPAEDWPADSAAPPVQVPVEELARQQGVSPLTSIEEARANIWDSDEELDEFLADFRASRDAELA
jgi:hypothetical protein